MAAMKTRDATEIRALRSALGAIDNAESIAVSQRPAPRGGAIAGAVTGLGAGAAPRRDLSSGQVAEIVQLEIDERRDAADDYDRLGRYDDAARLRAEASVIAAHVTVD